MGAQHTPGPWTVCRDNPVMVRDREDTLIADCDNWIYQDDGEQQLPDCEANARLIATTPELLELAYQYLSDLRRPPTGDSLQRRIERAEKVIARATGAA